MQLLCKSNRNTKVLIEHCSNPIVGIRTSIVRINSVIVANKLTGLPVLPSSGVIGESGGRGRSSTRPPNGTQFFRFHIHFQRKVPMLEVGALNGVTTPKREILDPPLRVIDEWIRVIYSAIVVDVVCRRRCCCGASGRLQILTLHVL